MTTSRKTAKLICAVTNCYCTCQNKYFECKGLGRIQNQVHAQFILSNSDRSQLSKTYHIPKHFQIISFYRREFCSMPCLEQFKSGTTDMLLISKPVIPPAAISRQLEKSVSLCHNFCSTCLTFSPFDMRMLSVIRIKSDTLNPEITKLETSDLFLSFYPSSTVNMSRQ